MTGFSARHVQPALQLGATEYPCASTSTNHISFSEMHRAISKDGMGFPMKIPVDGLACNPAGCHESVTALEDPGMTKQLLEPWQDLKHLDAWISQHAADVASVPRLQTAAYGGQIQQRPACYSSSAPPGVFFSRPCKTVTPEQKASNRKMDDNKRMHGEPHGQARAKHNQATATTTKVRYETLEKVVGELRSSGNTCGLSFASVRPHVLDLAVDKDGVQFLLLQCCESEDVVSEVCQMVLPETRRISADEFGRDLMQGLLELATAEQLQEFSIQLAASIKPLSCDVHGCRVIQKAFEKMPPELGAVLVDGLKERIDQCMKHIHGNHVIQKCIVQMPPESVSFIAKAIINLGTRKAASHQYVCRVVMRLLEFCGMNPQVQAIRESIVKNACALAQDRYGNYAVQHLLENGSEAEKQFIFRQFMQDDVLQLAKHKYAHNVVVKCMDISQDVMVKALLSPPIEDLVTHRFGAQLVEQLFERSTLSNRNCELLRRKLLDAELKLRGNEYATHALAKVGVEFAVKM